MATRGDERRQRHPTTKALSAEQMLAQDLFDPQDPWAHYITNALKAKDLFIKM